MARDRYIQPAGPTVTTYDPALAAGLTAGATGDAKQAMIDAISSTKVADPRVAWEGGGHSGTVKTSTTPESYAAYRASSGKGWTPAAQAKYQAIGGTGTPWAPAEEAPAVEAPATEKEPAPMAPKKEDKAPSKPSEAEMARRRERAQIAKAEEEMAAAAQQQAAQQAFNNQQAHQMALAADSTGEFAYNRDVGRGFNVGGTYDVDSGRVGVNVGKSFGGGRAPAQAVDFASLPGQRGGADVLASFDPYANLPGYANGTYTTDDLIRDNKAFGFHADLAQKGSPESADYARLMEQRQELGAFQGAAAPLGIPAGMSEEQQAAMIASMRAKSGMGFAGGTDGQAKFQQWLAANPPRPVAKAPAPMAYIAEKATPYLPAPAPNYTISQTPAPGQGGRYRGYQDGGFGIAQIADDSLAAGGDAIGGKVGAAKAVAEGALTGDTGAAISGLGGAAGGAVGKTAGAAIGTAFGGPLGGAIGGALGSAAGSALGTAAGDAIGGGAKPQFQGWLNNGTTNVQGYADGRMHPPMGYASGKPSGDIEGNYYAQEAERRASMSPEEIQKEWLDKHLVAPAERWVETTVPGKAVATGLALGAAAQDFNKGDLRFGKYGGGTLYGGKDGVRYEHKKWGTFEASPDSVSYKKTWRW